MHGTDSYLRQCSLDRDHVCRDVIDLFCPSTWIGLEGGQRSDGKCYLGSLRLLGMQNAWRNLHGRSLFFCQIRNQFFLKRRFFQRSGRKMEIELVSSG